MLSLNFNAEQIIGIKTKINISHSPRELIINDFVFNLKSCWSSKKLLLLKFLNILNISQIKY